MPRFQVAVTDFILEGLAPEQSILADIADVYAIQAHTEADLVGRIEDADAIMQFHTVSISADTIARLQHCRLIVRCGVGYDNVDYRAAAARGIPVANVPDYGTEEVADSAIGLMLALTRGITQLNQQLRDPAVPWTYQHAAPLQRLRGRTFGIIGLGRIGTAAALRAKAFGLHVLFHDPHLADGYDKALGITRVETLDELLSRSHIVSIHCPLTSETRHLINATTLAKLPPGAYLINTARGPIIDTRAIPDALATGQLAGCGLDVLETEPANPLDPLIQAWRNPAHAAHTRLIVNPHVAFYSEQGLLDMRLKGAQACRRALLGEPLRNVVNQR